MTANAASAVRAARMFFEPDCIAAKAGLRAWVRVGSVIEGVTLAGWGGSG